MKRPRFSIFRLVLATAFAAALWPVPAAASTDQCIQLAANAGAAEGLPDGLLPAISMVEAGRADGKGGVAPWPWTLNQGGKGMYFDTREEALAYLKQAVDSGVTNIDVGCMQLNWKWHSAAFASLEDMIDPAQNTAYAARFMDELHTRLGSWEMAASAYHSTDPARGARYLEKVIAAKASIDITPEGETTLLAGMPMALDGILAYNGQPLVALGGAQVAAGDGKPAAGFEGETPFDDAEPVDTAALEEDPDLPFIDPAESAAPVDRGPPPDLPMVVAAAAASLAQPENLPPRLQRRWAEVEEMRAILAGGE